LWTWILQTDLNAKLSFATVAIFPSFKLRTKPFRLVLEEIAALEAERKARSNGKVKIMYVPLLLLLLLRLLLLLLLLLRLLLLLLLLRVSLLNAHHIRYEIYDEEFPIKDGHMTAADIDEMYCLSDQMPKCRIMLSEISPRDRLKDKEGFAATGYVQTIHTVFPHARPSAISD
jgi:hypothetical protein